MNRKLFAEFLPWILFLIMAANAFMSTVSGMESQTQSDKWFKEYSQCMTDFTAYVKDGTKPSYAK